MLEFFSKIFPGLWLQDLFVYPLAACLLLALIRLCYRAIGCRS